MTHPLGDVGDWWEEAELIIEDQARQLGNNTKSGGEKEYRHEAELRNEGDEDCEMGYRTESSLMPSDFSESKKAEKLRCEHAHKNWGLGHDEMDNAEEEADDEKIMEEEDEQERRQMKKKKGTSPYHFLS